MGPWFVLVSLCFRENVVATCKIGSFLCMVCHESLQGLNVNFFVHVIKDGCQNVDLHV